MVNRMHAHGHPSVAVSLNAVQMRTVVHDGNREPLLPPRVTQKHSGFCRNESGGLFTS